MLTVCTVRLAVLCPPLPPRGPERFAVLPQFLRKQLKLNAPNDDAHPNLFVYCNSAFCPSPDQTIWDIYEVKLWHTVLPR